MAAKAAERAGPALTVVDVQMTGAAGRHRRARPLTENSNGVIGDSANTVVSDDVHVAELALAEYDLAPDST